MILACTGHRPHRMGHPEHGTLVAFAISQVHRLKPSVLITGLALGWDLACGIAAIKLDVPVWAISPYVGQADRWPPVCRQQRDWVIDRAEVYKELNKAYRPDAFIWRNVWMVNNCQEVLALYSGAPGGTDHCVRYATSQSRPVHNLWDKWNEFKRPSQRDKGSVLLGPVQEERESRHIEVHSRR